MNKVQKIENAQKVISYWYTMEFLNQAPIISKSDTDRPLIMVFGKETKFIADALYTKFRTWTFGNVNYYVGAFYREDAIKELVKLFHVEDPRVEKQGSKDDFVKLAVFLVQTDQAGHYVKNSFQLSPILWAIKQLKSDTDDMIDKLDIKRYQAEIKKWDEKFQEIESENKSRGIENDLAYQALAEEGQELSSENPRTGLIVFQKHLQEIYNILYQEYKIPDLPNKPDILLECHVTQPPMISQNFYTDDLKMLGEALSKKDAFLNTPMGEFLLNYINDPNLAETDIGKRIDVNARDSMTDEEKLACKHFFATVLNARYAPVGRWPTQYPPALMQQVAINMVSQIEEQNPHPYFHINGPIFSVNGPPGTGKTTLLKEIIVNNVVQRARLLTAYEEADQAFEARGFKYGTATLKNGPAFSDHRYHKDIPGYYALKNDKINNYGMLVTSCNNKAVENITTDIPVDEEVSDFIEKKKNESPFLSLNLEDFYFTHYTQKLLNNNKAWGLIAAPMGKSSNRDHFLETVLNPLVTEAFDEKNIEQHKNLYRTIRNLFKTQFEKVNSMQKELAKAGDLALAELQNSYDLPSVENLFASTASTTTGNSLLSKSCGLWNAIKRLTAWDSHSQQTHAMDSVTAEALYDTAKAMDEKIATEEKEIGDTSKEKYISLNLSFLEDLFSTDTKKITQRHTSDPGFTHAYDQERKKLFLLSLLLHKEFILSSKCVKYNLENFQMLKKGMILEHNTNKRIFTLKNPKSREDYEAAIGPVLQTLFLLAPVISTTFASVQRFLDGVPTKTIGLLIVDESGQASPHMALGALFRSRAAVIVGDPKQVEPVVTDELDLLKKAFETQKLYVPYLQKNNSVQSFADKLNHFGTYLKEPEEEGIGTWVGSPLVVHRRCISPMFDISNELSYNGIMKKASIEASEDKKDLFLDSHSLWIDIKGEENGPQDHFVKKQAEYIFYHILQHSFQAYSKDKKEPDIFIISPFKTVADGMKDYIFKRQDKLTGDKKILPSWMNTHIGTVHTFQGQGAQEVIFFPGCCDTTKEGTLRFVNANIVNVAVTRAKSRLYVVGDWDTWKKNKNFKVLQNVMSNMPGTAKIKRNVDIDTPETGLPSPMTDKSSAQNNSTSTITESQEAARPSAPSSMTCQSVVYKKCPKCGALMKRYERKKNPPAVYWKCSHCENYKYENQKNATKAIPKKDE